MFREVSAAHSRCQGGVSRWLLRDKVKLRQAPSPVKSSGGCVWVCFSHLTGSRSLKDWLAGRGSVFSESCNNCRLPRVKGVNFSSYWRMKKLINEASLKTLVCSSLAKQYFIGKCLPGGLCFGGPKCHWRCFLREWVCLFQASELFWL